MNDTNNRPDEQSRATKNQCAVVQSHFCHERSIRTQAMKLSNSLKARFPRVFAAIMAISAGVLFRGTREGRWARLCCRARAHHPFWGGYEKNSAITTIVVKPNEPRLTRKKDYQETSAGWLPKRWSVKQFRDGKLVFSEDVEVEGFTVNRAVADGTFVLTPEPGMYIQDTEVVPDARTHIKSKSRHYKPEADGALSELEENLSPIKKN